MLPDTQSGPEAGPGPEVQGPVRPGSAFGAFLSSERGPVLPHPQALPERRQLLAPPLHGCITFTGALGAGDAGLANRAQAPGTLACRGWERWRVLV